MATRSRLRHVSLPAYAALAMLAAPLAAQGGDDGKPHGNEAGEAKLAKLLEGRTKGEPVRCLQDSQRRNMQIINRTAFVFRDGNTIYVNRPSGAEFLDNFDLPVFRLFSNSLCRLDQAELRDRSASIGGPIVILNDFIPYTLDKDAKQ